MRPGFQLGVEIRRRGTNLKHKTPNSSYASEYHCSTRDWLSLLVAPLSRGGGSEVGAARLVLVAQKPASFRSPQTLTCAANPGEAHVVVKDLDDGPTSLATDRAEG